MCDRDEEKIAVSDSYSCASIPLIHETTYSQWVIVSTQAGLRKFIKN